MTTNQPVPSLTHDQIAVNAYYLAEKRGGGDPVKNWLDAEKALIQHNKKAATKKADKPGDPV